MGLHGVLGTITLLGAYFQGLEGLFGALVFNFIILAIYLVLTFQENGLFFHRLGKQLFALCYLPLFLPFFILLRSGPQGIHWIFFVLAVNYAGDTAAYYTGRTLGRNKLAPAVSPKKTREGSIGGLAANSLMAWIFQQTLFKSFAAGETDSLGLTVGILSQFGDLLESMFKRASGVKDSGVFSRAMEDFWTGWTACCCRPRWFIFFFESDRGEIPVTAPKTIALLGSTGSIGTQALELVQQFSDRFSVCGLVAGRNISLLQKQIEIFRPRWVSVATEEEAAGPSKPPAPGYTPDRILGGLEGHDQIASMEEVELVVSALVGAMGLRPTLAAIQGRKDHCPGQQGNPGHGRGPDHGGSPTTGGHDFAGGQRTQRDFSGAPGAAAGFRQADYSDGFRRSLSGTVRRSKWIGSPGKRPCGTRTGKWGLKFQSIRPP